MKRFMNEVYCCEEPNNAYIYYKISVPTEDIFDTAKQYSTVFGR